MVGRTPWSARDALVPQQADGNAGREQVEQSARRRHEWETTLPAVSSARNLGGVPREFETVRHASA